MNSLIKKFSTGLKTDARDTIVKTVQYVMRATMNIIADSLYFMIRGGLFLLPSRTRIRLKQSLSPTTKLDYVHSSVVLQADSLLDLYRGRACEKEPETVEWIENYIRKGDVFFDIGANIGAYSLVACAHCGGEITVLSFEPSFSTFYQLCRNIIVNKFHKSITPYLIALSKKPELLSFNYQSLEAGSSEHWLGADLSESSAQFVYTQQLLAFSIDYLISEFKFPVPNHIKLDVDGSEVDVLRGAAKTLRNAKLKSILVEVRDRDGMSSQVNEMLTATGFQLVSKTDRGNNFTWNCIYARHDLALTSSL